MMKLHVLCGIVPNIYELLPYTFFTIVAKTVYFHNFDHLRKGVFHNLNLNMIKIDNKVNIMQSFLDFEEQNS